MNGLCVDVASNCALRVFDIESGSIALCNHHGIVHRLDNSMFSFFFSFCESVNNSKIANGAGSTSTKNAGTILSKSETFRLRQPSNRGKEPESVVNRT